MISSKCSKIPFHLFSLSAKYKLNMEHNSSNAFLLNMANVFHELFVFPLIIFIGLKEAYFIIVNPLTCKSK